MNLSALVLLSLALLTLAPATAVAANEPAPPGEPDLELMDSDHTTVSDYALPSTGSLTAAHLADGVWVRPQLNETSITLMLDNLQEWGIQNIYVDVFRSGETLFPSELFPQKTEATDRDWLAYIIEQGHSRNIRVHAWMQTLCWAEPGPLQFATTSVLEMHPEWADFSRVGNQFDGKSLARFVNPAVAEVAGRLTSLTLEICRYPVDGINLDALQYNHRADMGYHPAAVAEFQQDTGIDPASLSQNMARDSDWMRWTIYREDKLTSLVESVSTACLIESERQNRRIVLSAVVQPGYQQNRGANFRFQHWAQWVNNGLLDATTPACFDGDLPGLERQLWEVRSIHMGSDVACVPGLMLDPGNTSRRSNQSDNATNDEHPSLADQKRLLRNAGFQHCNIMDYQALLQENLNPTRPARRNGGLWGFFSGEDEPAESQ